MSDDLALVSAARINQYITFSSAALYLYDLLLTLGLEVDLLWPSKWTLIKVVYLLQRYLPLIDLSMIIALNWQFGEVVDSQVCEILWKTTNWFWFVGMTLSEGILMRRTLAVWGNSRKLCIALIISAICCIIPVYLFSGLYLESLTFYSISSPGLYCYATDQGHNHIMYLCWVFLTAYDVGLLILTAIPGFRAYKSGIRQSTLTQVLYRDGILYYVYLVAFSVANMFPLKKLPGDQGVSMLISTERVMYSVLASHVILHLREQAYQTQVVDVPNSIDIDTEAEFRRSAI
ncbi:hypothetical protein BDN72DRAFT_382160 [Pluteus cervinus]|uniref:Uncharacterized protein n=1 Tax=Pluteus cervinus TaxID=181527 RepID=A0ACD3AAU1_9AGAR|nr:hypothetical protein BDN72DRAFT_382160 [Pluteus cervinus]